MEAGRFLADRYRLVEDVGDFGFVARWRADEVATGNSVLVTLLREGKSRLQDELLVELQRFAPLSHPNIDRMLDVGADGDDVFIAREQLDGQTLAERVAAGPLTPRALQGLAERMLDALSEVHAHGLRHGWLNESKVFIVRAPSPPTVKILDCGVLASWEAVDVSEGATRVPGRLGYQPISCFAPEFLKRRACDHRVDLYAVGCLAYLALTGDPPFPGYGVTDINVLTGHISRAPERLPATVPPALAAWVMKLLSKSPDDRYPTAADALAALRATA